MSVSTTAIPPDTSLRAGRLLEVSELRMHFPLGRTGLLRRSGGTVRAVDGVSLFINRGETLGLVGESGSGKSTTARSILQLYRPTSGSVKLDGQELTTLRGRALRRVRRRMQMIYQDPYASLNPRMTVADIVGEPLDVYRVAGRRQRQDRVQELLRLVGLAPEFSSRYPHEFSGGQRQRIGIARALALEPDLVVADEPISSLDVSIQAQIMNLLDELKHRLGLTYLFVAHDLAIVRHISDRVAVMYLGKVVELAERDDLYLRPLHPYTRALLSAVPVPDPVVEANRKRVILVGEVPSPVNPPSGCRFRTRCYLYERLGRPEACVTIEPPFSEHEARHWAACHFVESLPPARSEVGPIIERSSDAGAA